MAVRHTGILCMARARCTPCDMILACRQPMGYNAGAIKSK